MELRQVDDKLGPYRRLVLGDTDSERYFALITQQVDAHGGDVAAGITAAARWIALRLPVVALNAIVTTADELWALRYPDQHALHVLEPPGAAGLHVRSATSSVRVPALDAARAVVVASERLDGETGWRMLAARLSFRSRPSRPERRVGRSDRRAARAPDPAQRPEPEHRHLSHRAIGQLRRQPGLVPGTAGPG